MLEIRFIRTSALVAGTATYFSRPWSCSHLLGEFSPQDSVPYAHFDYHGFAAMIGWISAFLFAVPIFWLARRTLHPVNDDRKVSTKVLDSLTFVGTSLTALVVGMPTYTQMIYMIGLPFEVARPVFASALAWMIIVFAFWLVFIHRRDARDLAQALKGKALLLVALIAMPKFLIVGSLAIQPR